MTHRLLPALLLPFLLALPARAQSYSDPGVAAGVHVELTRGRAGAAHLSGGAQVRARLTGGIAIEGLVGVRRDVEEVRGERVLSILEIPVQGSAMLFFFYRGPVQPYLLAGVGYYYLKAKGEGSNSQYGSHSENKFGFHGGAGVEVRLAPKVSLAADLRYVSLDVDAIGGMNTAYGIDRRGDFWLGSAGVLVSF